MGPQEADLILRSVESMAAVAFLSAKIGTFFRGRNVVDTFRRRKRFDLAIAVELVDLAVAI